MIEQNVTINGKVRLEGTLTIPDTGLDKYNAVIIVNSAGKADRDGNFDKERYRGDLYKEIAEFITEEGFIALRYDKRNIGESEHTEEATGMWDLVEDLTSMVEFLRSLENVNKVILLGHSEGSTLTTIVNKNVKIDGLIHIAGTCSNLMEQLKYQNNIAMTEIISTKGIKGFVTRLLTPPKKIAKRQEEYFEKILNSTENTIKIGGRTISEIKWMRDHFTYDVVKDYEQIECPILAIGGGKDVQTNPQDVHRLKDLVKGKNDALIIENMDHMLKEYNGEVSMSGLMSQYEKGLNEPVHTELRSTIINWLNENFK